MRMPNWLARTWQKMNAPIPGPGGIMRSTNVGHSDPPKRSTQQHLEVYEAAPWPRAVGEKVSTAVAYCDYRLLALSRGGKIVRDARLQKAPMAVRLRLLQPVRNDVREITDHPFLTALDNPNPYMDGMALLKVTEIHWDFVGDAFWLKDRNALGVPVGFWPIPPHWVIETPTPDKPSYRFGYKAWQFTVPASEVHWFHEAAPASPYTRGTGIGWTLGDEIQVDEYAAKMASAFFFNRARPDFVFATGLSEEETKRFELDWVSRLQGFWRAHRPYFLSGGGADEDIRKRIFEFQQPTMEQLVYPNLRKVQRDIILQTWGVSPELFGIVENSNRATIEAAEYLFLKHVVAPKAERMRGALQRLFIEDYDERGIVHCDSPVPDDKEYQLNVAKAAPHSLQLDEWRALAGLPPLNGPVGKLHLVPLNSYLTDKPWDQEARPETGGGGFGADEDKPGKPPKEAKEALALPAVPNMTFVLPGGEDVARILTASVAIQQRSQEETRALVKAVANQRPIVLNEIKVSPQPAPVVNVQVPTVHIPAPIVKVENKMDAPKLEMPKELSVAITSVPATRTRVTKRGIGGIEETETGALEE